MSEGQSNQVTGKYNQSILHQPCALLLTLREEISTMDEINQQVLEAIENMKTIGVVVDLPIDILAPDNYMNSAFDFIKPLTITWEENNLVREIAVDIYPRHAYVVVDINNHRYDFERAHLQDFTLPVYILRLSRKRRQWTFFRRVPEDRRVDKMIAELHRCNGKTRPSFLADHIKGSVYLSPRRT
ncbi:hypothetical protein BJY04DRAFT_202657 [Aspergillus karnatakaensis]|uniref:uncharacterized protein n=1 Tax=Aspergillus karnatakaensis TaxID=1810916 RepID=UPI003CCE4D36